MGSYYDDLAACGCQESIREQSRRSGFREGLRELGQKLDAYCVDEVRAVHLSDGNWRCKLYEGCNEVEGEAETFEGAMTIALSELEAMRR